MKTCAQAEDIATQSVHSERAPAERPIDKGLPSHVGESLRARGSGLSDAPVVICGGGISGLTLAYRLHQRGVPFELFERGPRFGGNIFTVAHDDYLYDLGPDSFLRAKPEAAELCRELGLGDELISPEEAASSVLVVKDRTLYPMPEGLTLGVPKRPGPILDTPLLSPAAKLRALCEPFLPPRASADEETIFDFLARRLGKETAEQLAAPLLAGVFAGDARKLSMNAAFPQLVTLEKKYGSLFAGMNGGKTVWQVLRDPVTPPQNPFLSLKRGMGQLVHALVDALPAQHLHLNTPIVALRDNGFGVASTPTSVVTNGGELLARHVCFAGPPWAAAELLGLLDGQLRSALRGIAGFPTATIFFGLDAHRVPHDLTASGFIVPPGEAEILAATFISSKWAHRAPPGKVLVRAFMGGARYDISDKSDAELLWTAEREFTALLGDWGEAEWSRVFRYEKGTPQPEMGHQHRLERIQQSLLRFPWLSLIGSGYGAVGIPDCVRQANQIAEKIAAGSEKVCDSTKAKSPQGS